MGQSVSVCVCMFVSSSLSLNCSFAAGCHMVQAVTANQTERQLLYLVSKAAWMLKGDGFKKTQCYNTFIHLPCVLSLSGLSYFKGSLVVP